MELTLEQQQKILDKWNENPTTPPSLKELTQLVFGGDFDGRSDEGKSIKLFLATKSLRAKATSDKENKVEKINLTEEHKLKVSESVKRRVKAGTWHTSFANTKRYEYVSKFAGKVQLHGKWELAYAKYLDNNDIEWRRPTEKFLYKFKGLKSGSGYYHPDFYLIKEQTYVEIKGYQVDKDLAKWEQFPEKLKVLKQADLKKLKII